MNKHLTKKAVLLLAFALSFCTSFAQNELNLKFLSTYRTGLFNQSAAEIAAFDAASARLFFTNAAANTVTILDISNPAQPTKIADLDMSPYGGGANSVAIYNGLVAIAVEGSPKTEAGKVIFLDINGNLLREVTVGALPDMLTFSHDGTKVLVANEGEPNDDYSIDPEGSVSIIDLSTGVANATVRNVTFESYNDKKAALLNKGIRIFGPNATVAQDLEPEYITLSPDDTRAYVALQENNAFAVIDVPNARLLDILPLGLKDHNRGTPVLTQYFLNNLLELPELGVPSYNGGQPPVKLGGFSGLYFDAAESDDENYVFYTIPDRGPNDEAIPVALVQEDAPQDLRPFKLPDYQARIVRITLNINTGAVTLGEPLFLTQQNGQTPITGKGNVPGFDEIPVTYTDPNTPYPNPDYTANGVVYHELPYDRYGGDFEGIVRDQDGNFWLCDEYRPALYKFAPNGTLMERYVPAGTHELGIVPLEPDFFGRESLPAVYSKRWANRGFEAIAYDSDANIIYGFIQSPMFNPDNSTRNRSDVIRILGVDAQTGVPVSEYVYLLERNRDAGLAISRVDKIGDAVYTGNGKFLVLERDSSLPGEVNGKKYIYEINLKGATNILGSPLSNRAVAGNEKTLEQMSADELAAEGIVPVHKRKVLNLPSIGYLPGDKPEGLALLPNGAMAVINDNDFGLAGAGVSDDISLGIITFEQNYGLDASDRDNAINIRPYPVYGIFQPDAITTYEVDGQVFLLSANEGDARAYSSFDEEARVSALTLSNDFPNGAALRANALLGRLTVTRTEGDLDANGRYDELHVFGARSFSIWDTFGNLVYDSGDDFEQVTAARYPQNFNASNNSHEFDNRSDNKGPEPEAIAIGQLNGETYAFIGLERTGGIMIYNISNPYTPYLVDYVNNRDFGVPVSSPEVGDLGVEHIIFIPAADSPNGDPLLVTSNEVSGTVSIFTFGELPVSTNEAGKQPLTWRVFPNPVQDVVFTNILSDYTIHSTTGQLLLQQQQTNRLDVRYLPKGAYLIRDTQNGQSQLFVKQ